MSIEFKAYPFDFIKRASPALDQDAVEHHTVAIVGGGVAGLTAALALSAQGVRSVVIEADDTVCYGSRAICFSRRTLEIFDRIGVLDEILAKGLAWEGGRSFYRDKEVLHFKMPHDENQKLPPMINLQQYYLEEYLVRAAERRGELIELRWSSRVKQVEQSGESVRLAVEHAPSGHSYRIEADYVVCCDGGRSTMRELLGLKLQGTAYEGRYVVADIELQTDLPTERLAWFDPPSNPGSTILMHKQPDNIWRIDYQLRDDEDPDEAVKPENVLPRVQAHLEMIGQTGAWAPLWITIYKANALTLERYRHGRVFFAGDAAHLVPIFGVRGANSAIDDVDNLSWKLAHVIHGHADQALLDSYSDERVFGAHENLKSGMKSTEFMAPPTFAFKMMREAVLSLALDTPAIRSLINPRQTSAITYVQSPLNASSSEEAAFACGPRAGSVLSSVPVVYREADQVERTDWLSALVQPGQFLVLEFGAEKTPAEQVVAAVVNLKTAGIPIRLLPVRRTADKESHEAWAVDETGTAFSLYDASPGAVYLVRPDGHVLGRWRAPSMPVLEQAVREALAEKSSKETVQ